MFDNTFYKRILDSSPIGYAYHEILCDEKGVPYDYKYIETNQAFEKLTGLNRKNVIGKTVTKVLPGILESEFDWIACYGEVALTGKEKTFNQYSETLKKWYRVNAFSPKKGYFVTIVVDVTNEKEQSENLTKVLETSDDYLDDKNIINYQKITNTMMELAEAKVAALNIYDEIGDTYRTVAISADSKIISKGTEILGMNLEGKVWKHDPVRAEKIKNKNVTRFNKLSDLTGDVIPSAVVDLLVKSFGLRETILVKIAKDDRMIGDFTLLMEKEKSFDKDAICEIYAKQLGLAIEIKKAERKLSNSRQAYKSLIENAPGVVFRCLNNHNWTMLMMSNEIKNISGYDSNYFIKDQEIAYISIIHPEDVNVVSKEIQKAILANRSWSIDYRIVHKDGSFRWIHENGCGIKNEEGNIIYLDGIIIDITLQKKLEEQEIKHKKLTSESFDVISILSTDGTILFESESTIKTLGYPAGERVGKNSFNFVHEDDKEMVSKELLELITNPENEKKIEFRFLHNDGSWVWMEIIGQNYIDDPDIKGIITNTRDISDRKKLEEELLKKQKELDNYFTSSLDMLCIANTKGQFIRLNPEWEKVLGYPIKELEGSIFLDYIHPDDLEATLDAIKELESQKEVLSFTNRYRCKDGNYRWIEWRSKPVNQMIYAVARDITEHIKLREILSNRERQYRLLAENVADVVWTTDLELNTTWVSPSIYQLTGETTEEHMKTSIQDRYNQNDLIKLNHLLQKQLLLEEDPQTDKKRSFEIELQQRKKDGNSVWVSMKMTFLRDRQGFPIGIHGVTRDISERVEKDQAIQKQKDQQQILLSASQKLIDTTSDNLSSVIETVLSQVAQISEADRVYLFEHDYHLKVTNIIYEWCDEGIVPLIEILKNVPFTDFEEWLYYHRRGESIVINDVKALSKGDTFREILEPQGIKSFLSVPVFFEAELFGFIGFDSVREHHFYTKEEQAFLHQFATNLVMTIKKDRYTSKLKITEKNLRSTKNILENTFNSIQDGIIVLNVDLTIKEVNDKIKELYGDSSSLVGSYCYEVYQNRKTPCENCPTLRVFETKNTCSAVLPLIVNGQQKGWLEVFAYPMVDSSTGNLEGVVEFVRDITERKKMEKQIVQERERFRTTLLSVGDGIISTDAKGNVMILNPIAEKLTGWTKEEALGKPIEEVFYIINEYTRKRCENPVQKVLETGEIIELANHTMLISKYGIERPIEDSAAPIRDLNDMITGVVLVFRDFTEKKKNQDEIKYLSFHDHLTGLYNRRFFEIEMERLDTERNLPISIIMGDVNGLKLINDSFGHSVGDDLLIKATKIIKNCLRADDIVARIGGDECAVLLPKTSKSDAETLVKRMQSKMKGENIKDIDISVSFGLETKTKPTESLDLILKQAEDCMYNNKLFEGPSIRGKAIQNIISAIHEKSPREKEHSDRVSNLCVAIGNALKMNEKDLSHLKILGLFHDIGKIAVSDDILNKPDKLTDREYKEIRRHSEIGYRILSTANGMSEMAEFVLYHHERWDGKGYPKGLSGEAIPFYSRICALADAYDAMTSNRSYRPAMTNEFAIEELQKNSGTQFDPVLVKVFIENVLHKPKKEE